MRRFGVGRWKALGSVLIVGLATGCAGAATDDAQSSASEANESAFARTSVLKESDNYDRCVETCSKERARLSCQQKCVHAYDAADCHGYLEFGGTRMPYQHEWASAFEKARNECYEVINDRAARAPYTTYWGQRVDSSELVRRVQQLRGYWNGLCGMFYDYATVSSPSTPTGLGDYGSLGRYEAARCKIAAEYSIAHLLGDSVSGADMSGMDWDPHMNFGPTAGDVVHCRTNLDCQKEELRLQADGIADKLAYKGPSLSVGNAASTRQMRVKAQTGLVRGIAEALCTTAATSPAVPATPAMPSYVARQAKVDTARLGTCTTNVTARLSGMLRDYDTFLATNGPAIPGGGG